jgi:hypothetical protein
MGLKGLSQLINLKSLDIYGNKQITNKGLLELSKLKNLQRLNINFCKKITKEGKENFKKVLPNCYLVKYK